MKIGRCVQEMFKDTMVCIIVYEITQMFLELNQIYKYQNLMEVSQKTKNWSIIWSSNPSTEFLPQRLENPYLKRYLHTDVHSSIIHSGQDMEATEVSLQ